MRVFQVEDGWSIEHVRIGARPDPQPGAGQVRVRMRASALNYRDLLVPARGYGSRMKPLPLIMLSDGVGVVDAVGERVAQLKVGDRVCPLFFQTWSGGEPNKRRLSLSLGIELDGTMAELMVLPVEGVAPAPAHLDDVEAAALPTAAVTAWRALVTEGRVKPGDTVIVQGTGGVALFALQFAKLLGAYVIVTSSSDDKLARVRALGADETINYRTVPEWGKRARDIAGDDGVDHVVDVGGQGTLPQSSRQRRRLHGHGPGDHPAPAAPDDRSRVCVRGAAPGARLPGERQAFRQDLHQALRRGFLLHHHFACRSQVTGRRILRLATCDLRLASCRKSDRSRSMCGRKRNTRPLLAYVYASRWIASAMPLTAPRSTTSLAWRIALAIAAASDLPWATIATPWTPSSGAPP